MRADLERFINFLYGLLSVVIGTGIATPAVAYALSIIEAESWKVFQLIAWNLAMALLLFGVITILEITWRDSNE